MKNVMLSYKSYKVFQTNHTLKSGFYIKTGSVNSPYYAKAIIEDVTDYHYKIFHIHFEEDLQVLSFDIKESPNGYLLCNIKYKL